MRNTENVRMKFVDADCTGEMKIILINLGLAVFGFKIF